MTVPIATYRVQFRNGMTFDRATGVIPYLKRLGISHLYASPIFTAASGSTHGYDVIDANEIDPAIGGRDGFDRLVSALKAHGLGLILDIVPNHMAASLENAWWRDVIQHGQSSAFANHFDIDWSRRLTLPFLSDTFENLLDRGEIGVEADPKTGRPALVCGGSSYPLNPETYAGRTAEVLRMSDKRAIARLHAQQSFRLMSWRDAPRELSYRRFFEIVGLVGVRVEDQSVFDDTHRLILDLVRSGAVQGLRVDHIDGLADPKGYLENLRSQVGADCYITVEKILAEGEELPSDWPVAGTTGYEFISAISQALVDGDKLGDLRAAFECVSGQPIDIGAETRAAKLLMVENNFAGEFAALVKLALDVGRAEPSFELAENSIRSAIRELLVSFPVYRTYGTPEGLTPQSLHLLEVVLDRIRNSANAPESRALTFVERILRGDVGQVALDRARIFRTRFEQLTGPLMAKSIEDTLFFRQPTALALNEVGGEPLPRTFSVDRFHSKMRSRAQRQPGALSATSTHDTKRGEDARARLYAITEAPQYWSAAVKRWREINRDAVAMVGDGPAPEPSVEWMLYQALAGAWPTDLEVNDAVGLKALEDRFVIFVEKALREAKLRTNWVDPDEDYEAAVIAYARRLLSPANERFLSDFTQTLRPFARAGLVNSTTHTVIKLTAPGVPDIYQGSEGLDLSLVDPDNRQQPDYETLEAQIAANDGHTPAAQQDWDHPRLKQRAIELLLGLRREQPDLFNNGEYRPLEPTGEGAGNMIAFARTSGEQALIVVAPRLAFERLQGGPSLGLGRALPQSTIPLPDVLSNRSYRDVWSGRLLTATDHLRIIRSPDDVPFLVLRAEG